MRWVEHFSELLNPESEIDQNVLNEIQQLPIDDSLDLSITHEEVEKALKNTRLKKSPGPDGILPEIIVFGGQTLKSYILEMFNTFWINESIPAELINPNISILYKKGDRSECGNYRGISLLSTVGKTIADIVLQRIQNLLPNVYPKNGQLLTTKTDIKMRWVEHFSELLNPESEIDQNVLNEIQQLPIDDSLDLPRY